MKKQPHVAGVRCVCVLVCKRDRDDVNLLDFICGLKEKGYSQGIPGFLCDCTFSRGRH